MLEFFKAYSSIGFKPIALIPNKKMPFVKRWNKNWDYDYWHDIFQSYPESNIGFLLGDIIDVEGDSDEANEIISQLIGDVPHPSYQSLRSVHHLFLNPDPYLTSFRYQGIEFRGSRHQSVAPPSYVQKTTYAWTKTSLLKVKRMPNSLLNFYWSCKQKVVGIEKEPCKLHTIQTTCKYCNKLEKIHKKRLTLEVHAFQAYRYNWMCQNCRKMKKIDIREDCRQLKKTKTY